ncbi:hypothetical protein R3W88_033549 [Solanum pinnatisectum]|uniref:DUF4283 domain-containing protein n=1 Tax=Solanum pinnatisectum TaxID=50273 RepID=A0AAV9K0Q8_9SOLN|nr:hypothetical protein R3W88_033549 [Solanum pinnatisectum]
MGKSLDYDPPTVRDGKLVVKLMKEDIRESDEHWATSLIGYVLGDTPFEKCMDNYVIAVWNFVHKPQILYHSDGYYVFQFASIANREEVIKVVSAVGKPLYTDRYTIEMNHISYARVLVEVDISQPLVEIFGHDNEEYWAKVSHDPLADDFKEAPRRKRRAMRKRRNIQTWQARLAITDEAPDPALEVNIHACANKDYAGHRDVIGNTCTTLSNIFEVLGVIRGEISGEKTNHLFLPP